ncbi:conserved Plasmodium protein, unknown function [Plasmodium ovale]|uniref:Uncharacterized protein n=1 Tax=Plasmodium ovale TaxID=36330 RepID=A0A1D3TMN2_PLAOA|nr:conserved Plasmodium protein, unknown function [Plasmodium ovale]
MEHTNELDQEYPTNNNPGDESSQEVYDEKTANELKKKIKDLELQLEYEINRHEGEIKERDDTIKTLEEKITELETAKNETEEKDEAILHMSEQLLILSNKYDVMVKEAKLQEEELKHLKNKKKYRNDKTNEYIVTLKKQNDDFKNENEVINDRYTQLLRENNGLKNSCKELQEQLDQSRKDLEAVRKQRMHECDERSAVRILNLGTELIRKRSTNKDMDELSSAKLELEYKEMIIKKLIRKRSVEGGTKKEEPNSSGGGNDNSGDICSVDDQLLSYEKKVNELYKKFLDSQSDNEKLKKKVSKFSSIIDDQKRENSDLMNIIETLRDYINKTYKEDVNVHQYDDLINNLLKENSSLNEEISKQKRKNMADVYYYNKELQLIQNDKFKIIEKFDSRNVEKVPHLYEPLNVTLNEGHQNGPGDNGDDSESIHGDDSRKQELVRSEPKENSNMVKLEHKGTKAIITDDLVHIYMQDYMKNVQKKT